MYEAKQTRLGASIHCVKSVRIRSYSDLHFLTFGLNTEKYSISLRIQSECGKMRTRITPNKETFHAVKNRNTCFMTHSLECALLLDDNVHKESFNLRLLLSFCLSFCQFERGIAYKSVAYKEIV